MSNLYRCWCRSTAETHLLHDYFSDVNLLTCQIGRRAYVRCTFDVRMGRVAATSIYRCTQFHRFFDLFQHTQLCHNQHNVVTNERLCFRFLHFNDVRFDGTVCQHIINHGHGEAYNENDKLVAPKKWHENKWRDNAGHALQTQPHTYTNQHNSIRHDPLEPLKFN